MSDKFTELFSGLLRNVSEGGIAADLAPITDSPALVAPSTGTEFNQLRLRLIPKACWKLEDVRFGFDSSFLLPGTRDEMGHLAMLINLHTEKGGQNRKPPITIFGHADPVSNDDYNKFLSGRRAVSVFAALTRRTEMWEDLFSNTGKFAKAVAGDHWGNKSIQTMLNALGFSPGKVDGIIGEKTREAVRKFQRSPDGAGLAQDGDPGPKTREKLFLAYMNHLCGKDAKGQPFKVDEQLGFLALSKTPEGKANIQGCGEFNPILLFSKADKTRLDRAENKVERDDRNTPNRRVMVLLFRPGSQVEPARWPCPTVKDGVAGCKARFFADGESRRGNSAEERTFVKNKDTFACRFYDQMTNASPCEHPAPPGRGLGFLAVRVFFHARPMTDLHVEFLRVTPDGQLGDSVGEVRTDSEGIAIFADPVPIGVYAARVEHQPPKAICAIFDTEEPEILVLPIGRQYLDPEGDIEFEPND